jgi:glycosyltransferase involved in cell wall biosynthesis
VKIVFDAYWWAAGPPSVRHVLREIVFAWEHEFPDDELILVTPATVTDGFATVRSKLYPQALVATRAVARAVRIHRADAALSHNFAPKLRGAVSAIYLHDVLFVTNPEWFTRIERAYFSLMVRWVKRADVVFTSSETEADRIRSHTPARLVRAVGLGLSRELTASADPDEADEALRADHFVLAVGRLNVRKNLGLVINASLDTGLITPTHPLVIVGSANGRGERADVRTQNAIDDGSVVFTGFVSEARLRWYYRHCSLFVFLSLGEGFGMPPIEAAYFAAPVLASDLPVFHETLGRAATFVDPTNRAAVTAAIGQGIVDGDVRSLDRRPRGGIAALHDWGATVTAMREAIEGARA